MPTAFVPLLLKYHLFHFIRKAKGRPSLLEEQKEIQKKIGARIKQLRREKKISQERFANQFELDRSQVSRIERGTNIEMNTLVSFLRALDVTIQEFFEGIK